MKTELRCSREIYFEGPSGMRLRELAKFVKTANRFHCSVMLSCLDKRVDGKSFIDLSMLRIKDAPKILIETWGADASECLEALSRAAGERRAPELELSL
jgi:phosphotransferase system HPr (HPr) family protein